MMMKLFPLAVWLFYSPILQVEEPKPDAAALVREVRLSQAEHSYELTGQLEKGRDKVPLKISKQLGTISFHFTEPAQIISLTLKDNRFELTEQGPGQKPKELEQKRYGEKIGGTDVTYEDISQRFLYWSNPRLLGDEKLRITVLRDTWVVRLDNPRRLGPYGVVKIWIDKESKALLQVEGFDWNGSKVKRVEVIKAQKDKVSGLWLQETMRIETIDQQGKSKEKTYMKLGKPTPRK
jgi:hypothetical protein